MHQVRGFKPGRGPNPGYSPEDNFRNNLQWFFTLVFGLGMPMSMLWPIFQAYNKDNDDDMGRNIEHHTGHFPQLQGPKY